MKSTSAVCLVAALLSLAACGLAPTPSTAHLGAPVEWTRTPSDLASAGQAWRAHPGAQTALALARAYYPDLVADDAAPARALPRPDHALTVTTPDRAGAPLVLATRGQTFRVIRLDEAGVSSDRHLWAMAGATTRVAGQHLTHRVEEYEVVEAGPSYQARYRVELPAGRVVLRDAGDTLEFTVAPATRPGLRMHFPQVRDAAGRVRSGVVTLERVTPVEGRPGQFLAQGSFELTLGVELAGLTGPLVVDPGWSSTASMAVPRALHTTTPLASGLLLVAGGRDLGGKLKSAELYDPATNTWTGAGEMAEVREAHTATRLPGGQVLIAGGCNEASCMNSLDQAELYDPATGAWSSAGTMTSTRDNHTATLLRDGRVLLTGGATGVAAHASAELYDPATGHFTATGALTTGRYWHAALLLPSGQVMVAGGYDRNGDDEHIWSSVELYDPTTGLWTEGRPMLSMRENLTATILPSGKVLVAGGMNSAGALNSGELYDPVTGTWASTGSLGGGRYSHTATLLPQGKVLVTGGMGSAALRRSTELYDPATGKWTSGGNLGEARYFHTATLLPSGQVLLVGGFPDDTLATPPLGTAECFDSGAGGSTPTGELVTARSEHQAVLLPSGQVLVAGGWTGEDRLALAERFDPRSGTWSATGTMAQERAQHTLTLLPSGKVLAVGGLANADLVATTEVYDPNTGVWSLAGALLTPRSAHTATLLPSGRVLVTGGCADFECTASLASAELFDPATGLWTVAGTMSRRRALHTATWLPSGKLLVAGGEEDVHADASAELYDPATDTFSALPSTMVTPRSRHTATLLASGKLLAIAGWGKADYTDLSELYDPSTDTWQAAGVTSSERESHRVVVLPAGPLLLMGGCNGTCDTSLTAVEQFDPGLALWTTTGALPEGRARHSSTLLPSGQVLLAGGFNHKGNLRTAELYEVAQGSLSRRPVVDAPGSGLPGSTLLLTGIGFRGLASGSGMGTPDSASDFPLVTLQDADGQRLTRLQVTAWTETSATAVLPASVTPGRYLLWVTANGISGGRTFHVGPNVAPVARALVASTDEDAALPLVLEGEDSDGDALAFALVEAPAHGTLSGQPPRLVYMPAPDFSGEDTFTFKATDGSLESAPARATLTVRPVNDAPSFEPLGDVSMPRSPATLSVALQGVVPGGGADEAAQTLTWTATASDPARIANLAVTGPGEAPTVTFTRRGFVSAPVTLTVTVTDDGGQERGGVDSFSRTFTVSQTPENAELRPYYGWTLGCATSGEAGPGGLVLVVVALLALGSRTRRVGAGLAVLVGLVVASPAFADGPAPGPRRLKLAFTGLAAGGEGTAAAARTAGALVQAQLVALDAYDVVGLDDIQALLGIERQKELLGCSENAEACMAEVVGALNSDRGVSGELTGAGGTSVLTLSLLDLRTSKTLARVTRRVEGLDAEQRTLDAIGPAVVELVSADPALAGRRFSLERGFGGLSVGARAELELVRRSLAPVVFAELSGKRWGGAVAVIIGPTPGFRLEGRYFPVELGRVRPLIGLGATVFAPAVGARVVVGAEVRLGPVHVSGDAAFERFFNGDLEHAPNAVLVSAGAGWVF